MNERIHAAFDAVGADDALRDAARTRVLTAMRRRRPMRAMRFAPVCCLLLLLLGGPWLYLTPTAHIRIDINPSIALAVNRFDRIVGVEGRNDDGRALAEAIDVRFSNYEAAVETILASETIASLLDGDGVMTITVEGKAGKQTERIFLGMEHCAKGRKNIHCARARMDGGGQGRHGGHGKKR